VNPFVALLYEGTARAARLAAQFAPSGEGKTRRTFAARRGLTARWKSWAERTRDPARALLWIHAPSVGEGLQARPVLEALRRTRPDVQLAYTFFSPSAETFARALAVDGADFLPFDTVADARAMLDALRPRALAFSKLDVWPALTREAHTRGVRLGMISATLAAGSARRSAPARAILHDAYERLDLVGAVAPEDAERLTAVGVRAAAIRVTGDTRYDQVWTRAREADRDGALLAPLVSTRPTLVAGSTWPSDETPLLAAWRTMLRGAAPDARLIIAPHEPSASHCAAIERWGRESGLTVARLGDAKAGDADVVLVDRVGVLGELYAVATAAYVGGAFHAAGLHSVLEPAAYGVPVLFGPAYSGSRDAGLLIAAGGAASVTESGELAARLDEWVGDRGAAARAGSAAREVVRQGLGAAERTVALVMELLKG
jgi:3-deoxy-D-manno-octulosonic-acid transferase